MLLKATACDNIVDIFEYPLLFPVVLLGADVRLGVDMCDDRHSNFIKDAEGWVGEDVDSQKETWLRKEERQF
jgi:hypothetical protein